MYLFPFPYKYLIAVGLYFYILYSVNRTHKLYYKSKLFLFLPALIYGLLHIYWFSISIIEDSYRITSVIIDSNFFRINELFYLLFTILLISIALGFLIKQKSLLKSKRLTYKNLKWVFVIAITFLSKTIIDFLLYSIDLIIHNGEETLLFYYPNFILNTIFIYYIGYIGFLRPRLILNIVTIDQIDHDSLMNLEAKLKRLMEVDEIFTSKKVSLADVATQLQIKDKKLSSHINNFHGMTFPDYINQHRVDKVKILITSSQNRYTLVALAEIAGFSSKSSFYSIFKKIEGITPSDYKKSQN